MMGKIIISAEKIFFSMRHLISLYMQLLLSWNEKSRFIPEISIYVII